NDTREDEVAAFGGGGCVRGHVCSFRVFALGLLRVIGVLQASNVNLAHHEQGLQYAHGLVGICVVGSRYPSNAPFRSYRINLCLSNMLQSGVCSPALLGKCQDSEATLALHSIVPYRRKGQ